MGNKNYSKFSHQHTNNKSKEIVEEVVEKNVENIKETVEEVVEENVENIEQPIQHKIGVVTGCENLYVRKGPSKEHDPECVINNGTEVTITDESDVEFYKIVTPSNVEGYCMKKFINIKV